MSVDGSFELEEIKSHPRYFIILQTGPKTSSQHNMDISQVGVLVSQLFHGSHVRVSSLARFLVLPTDRSMFDLSFMEAAAIYLPVTDIFATSSEWMGVFFDRTISLTL